MMTTHAGLRIDDRFQVTIPRVKGSQINALAIEFQMLGYRGVECVSADPLTGSVRIHYKPKRTNLQRILHQLGELGWIEDAAKLPA
jgi:hypothetical protein